MTHTSGPSKPETINSALRHQCRYAIQFKIIIILITTFHSVRVTNKQQSSNAAYTFLVIIQLLVSRIERHKAWQDCFFGFVSLAIQRLPYLPPHFPVPRFPVPRFLLPRYQRQLNTQHCIYMSLQKLGNEQLTH